MISMDQLRRGKEGTKKHTAERTGIKAKDKRGERDETMRDG